MGAKVEMKTILLVAVLVAILSCIGSVKLVIAQTEIEGKVITNNPISEGSITYERTTNKNEVYESKVSHGQYKIPIAQGIFQVVLQTPKLQLEFFDTASAKEQHQFTIPQGFDNVVFISRSIIPRGCLTWPLTAILTYLIITERAGPSNQCFSSSLTADYDMDMQPARLDRITDELHHGRPVVLRSAAINGLAIAVADHNVVGVIQGDGESVLWAPLDGPVAAAVTMYTIKERLTPRPQPRKDVELFTALAGVLSRLRAEEKSLKTFQTTDGRIQYYERDVRRVSTNVYNEALATCKTKAQLPLAAYIREKMPRFPARVQEKSNLAPVSFKGFQVAPERGVEKSKAERFFKALEQFISKLITVASNISVTLAVRTTPHGAKGGFWDGDTSTLIQSVVTDEVIQNLYRGKYVFKIVSTNNEPFDMAINLIDNDFSSIDCSRSARRFICQIH